MEKQKDSKLVFCDKRTHEFAFDDIARAIKYAWEHKTQVWAISTPYGVFQPMSPEEFDNVFSAVMSGPVEDPIVDDLV